jgi:hypothetical protein
VPHAPFPPARHVLLFSLDCTSGISRDSTMGSWLLQVTVLALGLSSDLYLCRKYSYTGRIWNSLIASCVCRLLSLQMPGLRNKIKTVYDQGTKLRLFPWANCGEVTVTFQNFRLICRQKLVAVYNWHKISLVFDYPSTQSHDSNWQSLRKRMQSVSRSVAALLQSYDSTNVGLERDSVVVTWDPDVLLQGADNLDAICQREQPTDFGIRRRARKGRNTWPVDSAWLSNHVFIPGSTATC